MNKPVSTSGVIALVLANLVPLYGVLFLEWDAGFVVLAYWMENLVVGFYAIMKIVVAQGGPSTHLVKLGLVPFFVFHYGAFCGAHGFFILMLLRGFGSQDVAPAPMASAEEPWFGPLIFLQMLWQACRQVFASEPHGVLLLVSALLVSHGISFFTNYLGKKEFRTMDGNDLMFQPYRRIVLLHVVIILGAAPVLAMGSPTFMVVLLIAGKIAVDVHLHLREHRRVAQEARQHAAAPEPNDHG